MPADIIDKLNERVRQAENFDDFVSSDIMRDAATEIATLRQHLAEARAAFDKLEAALQREPKTYPNQADQTFQHNAWAGWRNKVLLPAMLVARASAIGLRALAAGREG